MDEKLTDVKDSERLRLRETPSPALSSGSEGKKRRGGKVAQLTPPVSSFGRPVKKYPIRIGIDWKVGARLEAKDFQGKWYPAKIIEINSAENTVLVHFDGWNSRYDEQLEMSSEDLRPLLRQSGRMQSHNRSAQKAVRVAAMKQRQGEVGSATQNMGSNTTASSNQQHVTEHKVGECVFAKWTDCRMYPGKISSILSSGSYEVLFYDGYKKKVLPLNVKTMPPSVQEEYKKAGLLPGTGKKNWFKELARQFQEKMDKDKASAKCDDSSVSVDSKDKSSVTGEEKDGKKRRSSLCHPGDTLITELPKEEYKCPQAQCTKTFRKRKLLDCHIKFYHPELRPQGAEASTVSDQSEVSSKRRRIKRDHSTDTATQEDNGSEDTKTTTTEEYQLEEGVEHMEKDEVVNCICQINEENGLMIQCDVCLCWQHAACMEINEDTLPAKYVCYVCSNPPGLRESFRYIHEQEWLQNGTMPTLSFLPIDPLAVKKVPYIQGTHSMMSDLLNVGQVLGGTKQRLHLISQSESSALLSEEAELYYLRHIEVTQQQLAEAMDLIEKQMQVLETVEAYTKSEDALRDIPKVSRSIRHLLTDVNKVHNIARVIATE